MSKFAARKLSGKESKGFLRNNIYVILAFIIPAALMALVFALNRFYPFGNRMIMVIDSWHQYYPFLAEYQQMLKEGSSVMYSWNTGGGANFLGVIANYLGSPLYLLSALVPSSHLWLPAFLAATVVLRVGVAGMSFAVFLRKVFRRNDLSLVTFSMMYALCAYILGYYWNMMWLDTVALMPLVIAGTVGVLRDKKFSLYIISLAVSVICSFYIGYMVCLFVLLFSIGYTVLSFVSLKESFKNAGKMLIYTCVALMITAAVTVPAYMALQVSDSAASAEGLASSSLINYPYGYKDDSILNVLLAIARTATNMLAYTKPIVYREGLPNIACGVLALVLVFFYVTNKKIKLKEKLVSICALVFFLLSFVINYLNYIWHAFATPAMVYYRFSFIFSFVILVMAYRAYTFIDSVSKKNLIFVSSLFVVYLAAAFLLQKKLSVLVTFMGAFVVILGIVLYRKKKLTKKVFSLLLCLFVVCEMGLSAYLGVRTVYSTPVGDYPKSEKYVDELIEFSEEGSGSELVRTEFLSSQTINDPALNGVYGITTFNSMVNSTYTDTFEDLGLAASVGNNRYEYIENTPVMNILLSTKYLIGRDGEEAYSKYLKPVATADECTLYENTLYVPSGFMTNDSVLGYDPGDGWSSPLHVQNKMFSYLTGVQEDVFEFVEPQADITCDYMDKVSLYNDIEHCYSVDLSDVKAPEKEETSDSKEEETTTSTAVSTEDEAYLPFVVEYEIPEDGEYYGYFRSTSVQDGYVTLSSRKDSPREMSMKFAYSSALGQLKKGDKIEVVINVEYGRTSRVAYYLGKLKDDVMIDGVETLRQSTMTLNERTDRGLKGTINASESGLFMTSVLYDKGWKAYVDGKEVKITPFNNTFIAFDLSKGEHTIEMEFTSQGRTLGLWISLAGVVFFVVLAVLSRRKKSATPGNLSEGEAEPADTQIFSACTEEENCTDTDIQI